VVAEKRSIAKDWARCLYWILDPVEPLTNKGLAKQIGRQTIENLIAFRKEGFLSHFLETFLEGIKRLAREASPRISLTPIHLFQFRLLDFPGKGFDLLSLLLETFRTSSRGQVEMGNLSDIGQADKIRKCLVA
jgi:hypothetical protein